jgi:hypothetical protein
MTNNPDQGTPPRVILIFVIALALVFGGGYFLVMKLIAMRHQEDCLLSGRKDCIPLETRDH